MHPPPRAKLSSDRRGNVAIMAGLVAVPLLGVIGLAIDFGAATAAKAQLVVAADAAALFATTSASDAYLAGTPNPTAVGQAAATQSFAAQAGLHAGVTISKFTVTVSQSGPTFTATIVYQGAVQTTLGKLFNVPSLSVAGTAGASLSTNPYLDIQVLLDVSSSMTIGASPTDIANLQTLTAAYKPTSPVPGSVHAGEACAFACHWSSSTDDYYALAERSGVSLRIDVLRKAASNLVTNIALLNTEAAFRLAIYTFGQSFTQVYPLSNQISAAAVALANIAPDVNDCVSNCPDTYFGLAMSSIASFTGKSGNGGSQATSQKFLFIVSDGLVDQYGSGGRQIGPITAANCSTLKAKGITIMTLYIPYLPLQNDFYNTYVAPIQSQIGPALQACATSALLYFQAADSSQIDTQIEAMLAAAVKISGHLTK